MKRCLVTGATGFVGKQLISELLQSQIEVVVAGRDPAALRREYPQAQAAPFDLENPDSLPGSAFDAVDCVFHLAARVHVMKPTAGDEQQFRQCNVNATRQLAERAANAHVRRFVFLSSVKVLGEHTQGKSFRDQDAPAPQDAYGRSKAAAEDAAKEISSRYGMELVIVRPPLVYGPGVGANFQRLLQLVDKGWPLPLRSIHNARSLIARSNLTHFLRHAATHPKSAGTWLVSDDEDLSTGALCKLIGAAMHKPARLLPVPPFVLKGGARLVGAGQNVRRLVDSLQVDISRTKQALGWRPIVNPMTEIDATVAWYRKTKHAA